MSHDEQEPEGDAGAAQNQIVRLTLKEYTEKAQTHSFFSEFKPDYLLSQLIGKV